MLYGAGLRVSEALDLRVKDLDFERRAISVRRGKGGKDRMVPLPGVAAPVLQAHLLDVRRQFDRARAAGLGGVALPEGLLRKYPTAGSDWVWQWVFPAGRVCRDARFGAPSRFHLHESAVQREVTRAVRAAGLAKRAGCHTLRHSFATHLLE